MYAVLAMFCILCTSASFGWPKFYLFLVCVCVFLPSPPRKHLKSLLDYVKQGLDGGATLVYGGKQVDRPGKA